MTDEEKDITKNFNTNECFIYNLTEKVTNLEEENAKLKGELKAVREILEELKESYNAVIDEVIDTARGYGLVSDSALFSYISQLPTA